MKKEFSSRIQLNMETEFRNSSSFSQYYMVGRSRPQSHLFQLFVTCGTDIFINMDEDKQSYKLLSNFFANGLVLCGTDGKEMMCDEASTVGDHKDSHKVGGFNPLVIDKTHFCRMFYHVSETRHAGFLCLHRL